jgi:hypothetical protein
VLPAVISAIPAGKERYYADFGTFSRKLKEIDEIYLTEK